MNHKIRVLFLDIDNTLLDFDAGAAWGMEQCFRKKNSYLMVHKVFLIFSVSSYHITYFTGFQAKSLLFPSFSVIRTECVDIFYMKIL